MHNTPNLPPDRHQRYLVGVIICVIGFFFAFSPLATSAQTTIEATASPRGVKVSPTNEYISRHTQLSGQQWALLIGINDYQHWPDLKTPVHDVEGLQSLLLEKYNYSPHRIITLIDKEATAEHIIDTFRKLHRTLERDDSLLIYYAGHGYLDEFDVGSWVPTDARLGALNQYFATDRIHRIVSKMRARHIFLVADACFSGSLLATRGASLSQFSGDRFFTEHIQRTSRQVLASGGLELVADIGPANHSIFAYHFLRELTLNDQPLFTATELSAKVAKLVTRNGEQTPQWSRLRNTGDENGEFFFFQTAQAPSANDSRSAAEHTASQPEYTDGRLPVSHNITTHNGKANDYIEVISLGTADMTNIDNPVQAELIALTTARHLGYSKLIEIQGNIKVANAAQYQAAVLENDIISVGSAGNLRGVKIIDETVSWIRGVPKATVTLRLTPSSHPTPPGITHHDGIDITNANIKPDRPSVQDELYPHPRVIRAQATSGHNEATLNGHESATIPPPQQQPPAQPPLSDDDIVY